MQQKNPGLAAVLGFFVPGVGQFYNGQFGKGIVFLIIDGINILLLAVFIGLITIPITAIISAYDCYKSAEKINAAGAVVISNGRVDAVNFTKKDKEE